jgi:LemA protein
MKKGLVIGLAATGIVFLAVASIIGARNSLIQANENISASWAQVNNVLQRRADLIPNLVATVKGYAKQEKDIFIDVAEARAKLGGARTVPETMQANNQLDTALSRLLVVVERYPELKSNQNFMALQDELSGTENRIAVERMRYNETVQNYNVLVQQFPSNIAARLFGFDRKDVYFEPTPAAKEVPKVQF